MSHRLVHLHTERVADFITNRKRMMKFIVRIRVFQVWAVWLAVGACFPLCAENLSTYVRPVPASTWQRSHPSDSFAVAVRGLLTPVYRYAMGQWRGPVKGFDRQQGRYLDLGGTTEKYIRPVAHEAFVLALGLKWGFCTQQVCGVPQQETEDFACRLTASLADSHRANQTSGGWGGQWQSALWAAQAAEAGWILWDRLAPDDREKLCRMLVYEADRFIDYTVPYYRDLQGRILHQGDTKAEENAWNSNILTVATAMMPTHPHCRQWLDKNIELQLSAYAAPDDARSDSVIDGRKLRDVLKGSNINADGTAVNHGRVHPDYMCAIMHNATNAWIYGLAGMSPLQCSTFNGGKVYYALTDLEFNGKTIYCPAPDGGASARMFFPQGNDWGTGRQDCYWLMDVMAHLFGWDIRSSVKALQWAKARNEVMKQCFARSTTGQYYQSRSESSFDTREEFLGAQLVFGYLGWWLQAR